MVCVACGRGDEAARAGDACLCGGRFVTRDALSRSAGDPLLGAEVMGRFVLLGPRAYGGRAAVHDALDRARGDRCVVKVIRCDDDADRMLARLRREASLFEAAPQAVVPAVRAVGAVSLPLADAAVGPARIAFLVADAIEGVGFAAAAERDGLAAARALLEALALLHEAGVVHGDLTPSHVFIEPSGAARLVDLENGACTRSAPSTDDAATPEFAAPERPRGPSVRSDLYAWARVVSRCLQPLEPPELAAAVGYALEPDPAARPLSAAALLRLLPAD